ncbi:hypothetical protein [Oxalobacter paraformigenes]|uniref:Uncharacterized protein n=1 Tax=Oxalobacter paraformigenes TaxID=556268 RepID=C3X162_9BURK|nr:hypothetical protein [Oxalobacter paraformigenes]EEO26948.1 hypothetical protein OFAG_00101 [Oxalobacter paraformigenes]
MEKEWISAFYDNEAREDERPFTQGMLGREETGHVLELYRAIGRHLRLHNPVPEVSESFRKNLLLGLQAEYGRMQCRGDSEEKIAADDELHKNKAEAL